MEIQINYQIATLLKQNISQKRQIQQKKLKKLQNLKSQLQQGSLMVYNNEIVGVDDQQFSQKLKILKQSIKDDQLNICTQKIKQATSLIDSFNDEENEDDKVIKILDQDINQFKQKIFSLIFDEKSLSTYRFNLAKLNSLTDKQTSKALKIQQNKKFINENLHNLRKNIKQSDSYLEQLSHNLTTYASNLQNSSQDPSLIKKHQLIKQLQQQNDLYISTSNEINSKLANFYMQIVHLKRQIEQKISDYKTAAKALLATRQLLVDECYENDGFQQKLIGFEQEMQGLQAGLHGEKLMGKLKELKVIIV